jgi:hypothetical protein
VKVLVVLGAGASYDCWDGDIATRYDDLERRLPLANSLFSDLPTQNSLISKYMINNIAARLRRSQKILSSRYNVEYELQKILDENTNDENIIESLFATRYYLHELIHELEKSTQHKTSGNTKYVDLINDLSDWTKTQLSNEVVIVSFNYDTLLEHAMSVVFRHEWQKKKSSSPDYYFAGNKVRIYKPHGSINWGRQVLKENMPHHHSSYESMLGSLRTFDISEGVISIVDPYIFKTNNSKDVTPVIAVPYGSKTDFKDCPASMMKALENDMVDCEVVLTIGWRGADKHFVSLMEEKMHDVRQVHCISPSGDSELNNSSFSGKINYVEAGFSSITNANEMKDFLARLNT